MSPTLLGCVPPLTDLQSVTGVKLVFFISCDKIRDSLTIPSVQFRLVLVTKAT